MHNHSNDLVEKIRLKDGFSFHPKIASWLKDRLALAGDEQVTVYEAGCNETSCPVEETVFVIEDGNGQLLYDLKIGRKKDQISKNDLVFALQKQLK